MGLFRIVIYIRISQNERGQTDILTMVLPDAGWLNLAATLPDKCYRLFPLP